MNKTLITAMLTACMTLMTSCSSDDPFEIDSVTPDSSSSGGSTGGDAGSGSSSATGSLTSFTVSIDKTTAEPTSGIATAYYLSEIYAVKVNLTWFVIATVVCTMMAIALPPIPGSGIGCYAIMLSRLEIPYEAIGAAIVLDIFFTFIGRAIDSAMLQMELIV